MRTKEVDPGSLTDSDLAQRAAAGDTEAFEFLYRRHADAAWRVAQAVTGNAHDAADAVSEAFTRLLQGMARGRLSPEVPFRPYLLTTTRNAAIDVLRRQQRVEPTDVIDLTGGRVAHGPVGPSERLIEGLDAALITSAFRSLPERWRSVLWLTEVEGMPAREVGQTLGLSANAAAQLAVRARAGLRERYLQAHIADVASATCRDTVNQLGAYAAGALSPRAIAKVDQHLAGCPSCRDRLSEIEDVESGLRRAMLPLPLLLAPAALDRFRAALTGASHAPRSFWLGGPRTAELSRRMLRPLATVATGLLAMGVISAAVMGDSAGPGPVAAGRPAALPPTVNTTVSPLAPAAEVAPLDTSGAVVGEPEVGVTVAAPIQQPVGSTGPPAAATPTPSTKPAGGAQPAPAVQLSAGANAGTTVSAAVGVGSGSCTGISVAGSPSCAPAAPTSPGVSITAVTPLGTTSAAPLA